MDASVHFLSLFYVAAWWEAFLPQAVLRCPLWAKRCSFLFSFSTLRKNICNNSPRFVSVTLACVLGVNIGGAGSYVYDNPVNEAPAAVSMETDGKPEEQKKAPARGPVKGEKYVKQK